MISADTVVALATAPGVGERAVLRLSGAAAFELLAQVLREVPEPEPGRLQRASLPLGDGLALPVELLLFVAPRSATGENVAEIHLPAWPAVVAELLARLVRAGARPAQRGEFTRRALTLGKLDLAQAEALGALGRATAPDAAAEALATLLGEAPSDTAELRERLLGTLALLEAHVDHEAEDTEALADGRLDEALAELAGFLRRSASAQAASATPDGELDVVLLGPPNAGKSSLLLALCPGARTTASPLAGTTRDLLEARREVAGRRLRFLDGPGVRRAPPLEDPLDRAAMRHFLEQLPASALVLDVEDLGAPSDAAERAWRLELAGARPRLALANKCDLSDARPLPEHRVVSARSGAGLTELLDAILASRPSPAPSAARRALLLDLHVELAPLLDELAAAGAPDALPLVALALREGLERLDRHEQRAAADLDEELLDRIFAGFCIGK